MLLVIIKNTAKCKKILCILPIFYKDKYVNGFLDSILSYLIEMYYRLS